MKIQYYWVYQNLDRINKIIELNQLRMHEHKNIDANFTLDYFQDATFGDEIVLTYKTYTNIAYYDYNDNQTKIGTYWGNYAVSNLINDMTNLFKVFGV